MAVDKAEVEVEKARIDAEVPREMRPAVEWRKFQATWHEKKAAFEKARLEQEAYAAASRSDIETARATEEKARRELAEFERSLSSMSLLAPRAGIFLVGNFWRWGPEGPRKLQPGDQVWPSFTVGTIPDPTEMEVQATLAEADHGRIARGMKARCILDTYPDQVFEGTVEEVGSVASEGGARLGQHPPGLPGAGVAREHRPAHAPGPLGAGRGGARRLGGGARRAPRRGPLREGRAGGPPGGEQATRCR